MKDRVHFVLIMPLLIAAGALLSAHANFCSANAFVSACLPARSSQPSVEGSSLEGASTLHAEPTTLANPLSAQSTPSVWLIRGSFPQYQPAISR